MVPIKGGRGGITWMCNGDNDPVCHGAWAMECRGRGGEREGQGRARAERGHVSAHVRPGALEALTFSMVGGVPRLEINKSVSASAVSSP